MSILASIAHPFIIKFYGASIHPPRVGYLMEYCQLGDLVNFLGRTHKDHPWAGRLRFLKEIASAQQFLHSKKIIHRDLKAENVLVANDLSIRLMDFGLSRLMEHTHAANMTAAIGTSIYMAPELTLAEKYDSSVVRRLFFNADLFFFCFRMCLRLEYWFLLS